MTTQEIKAELYRTKAIYAKNLSTIRLQMNRQSLLSLMEQYNTKNDQELAKILTIKGILDIVRNVIYLRTYHDDLFKCYWNNFY